MNASPPPPSSARLPGERIRADIAGKILSGEWPPGTRIPSEHALMVQYSCSRMTVNKVLTALATAGLVVRRRHAGSFVASPGGERAMMEIQDLAEEAARRGQPYRHEILASGLRDEAFRHVVCRHWIDARPYLVEDRLISLAEVPAAREENFASVPPGTWLLRTAPWSAAEHVIRACGADLNMADLLGIDAGAACLELRRRTWHARRLVTDVTLTYPGDRHSFAGRFSPAAG